MSTTVIPASRLLPDPVLALSDIADGGRAVVFELPDGRRLAVSPAVKREDDDFMDRLIESNADFRQLLVVAAGEARKPFVRSTPADDGDAGRKD